MELIILNDGLYQLIPVTKDIMEGIVITEDIDCNGVLNFIENFYLQNGQRIIKIMEALLKAKTQRILSCLYRKSDLYIAILDYRKIYD